jgi:uncharacterized protein YgiM (DUF1202 family)
MYVSTSGGTLNLRQSPNGAILAQIPNGTKLEVESYNKEWYKTTYKDKTGYVSAKFLKGETTSPIDKADLQRIYNSLKETLTLIEGVMK